MHSTGNRVALALVVAFAAPLPACVAAVDTDGPVGAGALAVGACASAASFAFDRDASGGLTTALLGGVAVAWFTDDAFTAAMTGPSRSFEWPAGSPTVTITHDRWIRTLPRPYAYTGAGAFTETELSDWLNAARAVNCDAASGGDADILDIAFQYDEDSASVLDGDGNTIAGDAGYELGADFHDYLNVPWTFPDGSRTVNNTPLTLDCSGYMRMVWGYRDSFASNTAYDASIPLSLDPLSGYIPRVSHDIYDAAPGRVIISFRTGSSPAYGTPSGAELDLLQVGDLVFFDSQNGTGGDATSISHVGMFVGADTAGKYRFLSSRSSLDGPTIANSTSGWSVFSQNTSSTYYPKRFRAARRL